MSATATRPLEPQPTRRGDPDATPTSTRDGDRPATRRARPKLDPIEQEALLIRHQRAIDLLFYPEVNGLEHDLPIAQRESLLAAVVWPPDELLAWSIEHARAKLAARL